MKQTKVPGTYTMPGTSQFTSLPIDQSTGYAFGACFTAACAAANRATGTRNGEQLT